MTGKPPGNVLGDEGVERGEQGGAVGDVRTDDEGGRGAGNALSGDVFEVDSDIQADPVNAEFYPDTATLYPPTKDHAL